MGLGPPVCPVCKMIMQLVKGDLPYSCPKCGITTKDIKPLNLFDLSEGEQSVCCQNSGIVLKECCSSS